MTNKLVILEGVSSIGLKVTITPIVSFHDKQIEWLFIHDSSTCSQRVTDAWSLCYIKPSQIVTFQYFYIQKTVSFPPGTDHSEILDPEPHTIFRELPADQFFTFTVPFSMKGQTDVSTKGFLLFYSDHEAVRGMYKAP